MPGGNYSIVTRRAGEVLTALEYNSDHQNHITNNTPAGLGGYSQSVTQMQQITDPLPGGVASLSPSLAGEIERLRYAMRQLKGYVSAGVPPFSWYDIIYPAAPVTKAIVGRTTGQVIANGVPTALSLSTAVYNDASIWSGGSPTRFTAPSTGLYFMGMGIHWNSAGAFTRILQIVLNGTTVLATASESISAGTTLEYDVATEYELLVTDYIEFVVFQNSGAPATVAGTGTVPYSTTGFLVKLGT